MQSLREQERKAEPLSAPFFLLSLWGGAIIDAALFGGGAQIGFCDLVMMPDQQLLILQEDLFSRARRQHRLRSFERTAVFHIHIAQHDLAVLLTEALSERR